MFNKVKEFCGKVAARVKSSFETVQTDMTERAHTVLDGTKAEAYVDGCSSMIMHYIIEYN